MKNPRLAARYAKSLLDLAIEQNQLDSTLADINRLKRIGEVSEEFNQVMRSPVIAPAKKNAIIEAITGSTLTPITLGFLKLLVNKGREGSLPEMIVAFIEQYKKLKQIHTVKITTAVPMAERVEQALKQKASDAMPNGTIEIVTAVNPEIIGGFVMEIGNSIVDASIRRDLNDVKKQFLENSYVSQIG